VDSVGVASAGASTTRYLLSLNTTRDGSDILLLGKRLIPELSSGAVNEDAAILTIPDAVAVGEEYEPASTDLVFRAVVCQPLRIFESRSTFGEYTQLRADKVTRSRISHSGVQRKQRPIAAAPNLQISKVPTEFLSYKQCRSGLGWELPWRHSSFREV